MDPSRRGSPSEPRDPERQLKRFWDESRDYYRLAAGVNPDPTPERSHLFAHLTGGERVLDLGCGSCENAQWLPAGCRYVGIDVSTVGLAMAGELGRPSLGVRADAETLPFADESFDVVLSTWVIEHFHEPGQAFIEIARVLRPGGLLLLVGSAWDLPHSLPPSLDPRRRLAIALRRLGRQLRSLVDGRHRFDVVATPLPIADEFVPDSDAVHVTQSYLVRRFLRAVGLEIVEQASLRHSSTPPSLPRRLLRGTLSLVPLWRYAWGNTLFVARKGASHGAPEYELLPL